MSLLLSLIISVVILTLSLSKGKVPEGRHSPQPPEPLQQPTPPSLPLPVLPEPPKKSVMLPVLPEPAKKSVILSGAFDSLTVKTRSRRTPASPRGAQRPECLPPKEPQRTPPKTCQAPNRPNSNIINNIQMPISSPQSTTLKTESKKSPGQRTGALSFKTLEEVHNPFPCRTLALTRFLARL